MTINNFKNFIGICLLTGSLAFGLWGCFGSDSSKSEKETETIPSSFVFQLGGTTAANGGDNSGDDLCNSVALDDLGNIYCAGYTTGALGEANGGDEAEDAFIMKLSSSGVLQWVTQLGGTTAANGGDNYGIDSCNSITLDDSKKYLLCRLYTWSFGRSSWGRCRCLYYET